MYGNHHSSVFLCVSLGRFLQGLFWSAHQRFFRSLCIASKVDKAIDMAKKALDDGHCCVIGLQSTGEARSKGAAKAAGYNENGGTFDDFVSGKSKVVSGPFAHIVRFILCI